MSGQIINLNDTSPAAAAGYQDVKWQKGATTGNDPTYGLPIFPVSAEVPNTGGVAVKTANYTAVAGDCGTLLVFNSGSAVTLTLPAAAPFGQWQIAVQNIGAGTLTINRNGLNIDGAAANLTLAQNAGVSIYTDGSNYFTERGVAPSVSVTGGGPIQILQSATPATGNPPLAPTFSLNVLPGSAIAVCIGFSSGSITSVTDSQSNTYTAYASGTGGAIYVATNVKGGSVTVTVAGPFGSAEIFELSNVASVEGSTFGTASSAPSVGTGSASTVYPFEFVLMTAFTSNNAASITNANSWPSVGNNSSSLFGNQANFATTVAAVGSVSNTANFSGGSGNIYAGFVILRPIMSVPNPMTTKGDVIVGGTNGVEHRLAVGSNGKVLTANSSATDGVDWETPAFQSLTTTGSSGAATLVAGVLNIPNYSVGGGTYVPSLLAQPPALASWTWVNQGGATADNNSGFIYMNAPASASFSLRMLEVSLSSTTFTYSVTFRPNIEIANSLAAGIGLRESSSGKVIFFYFASFGTGGAIRIGVNKYTNPTTYSSTLIDVAQPAFPGNVCFRIQQDGTNRKFSWGTDDGGHFPIQIASELQSTFMTPDQAVLIVDSETASWNAAATFNGMSLTYP